MSGFLLDTHVWFWVAEGAAKEVSASFFAEVESWQRERSVYISAISFWEAGLLEAYGHLQIGISTDELLDDTLRDEGLTILSSTPRILLASTRLPGDIHRDPADRILIATAREHDLTLVTRDKVILRYAKAGHVRARKC